MCVEGLYFVCVQEKKFVAEFFDFLVEIRWRNLGQRTGQYDTTRLCLYRNQLTTSILETMDFKNLQAQAQRYLTQIDNSCKRVSVLDQFENQTKLPRSYAVLAAGGVYILLVFLNFGGIGQLLSNLAGFVLPGYYSLKALKTKTTEDDTKLLTYWVVFAALQIIEFWSKTILYWIPAYFLFKTLFLVYIALPSTNGAELVYNSIISPIADRFITINPAEDLLDKVQEKTE